MKKLFTFILFSSLIIFVGNNKATASHFAGADLTYKSLGGNSYEITLSFYRDCSGIAAPTSAQINFNCSSNSSIDFNTSALQIPGSGVEITNACSANPTSCTTGPTSQYGIREYVYQTTVVLPTCADWTMSWSSGTRNPITIISGMPDWYIPAFLNNAIAPNNSSPIFINKPISIICNGQNHNNNYGAIDPDGDSLSYSFYAPMISPTATVTYNYPFTYNNFAPSTTPITIDSQTGNMNFTPSNTLSTITGIKVEEWRTINGVPILIGTIYRDVQLIIFSCNNQTPVLSGIDTTLSHIYNSSDTIYNLEKCVSNIPFIFHINGYDADTFNSTISGHPEEFSISWNNGIPNASFTSYYNDTDSAYAEFSWLPNSSDINITKCFTATIKDNACAYSGAKSYSYCITPRGMSVNIGTDTLLCEGESITIQAITDTATVNYIWNINGISAGIPLNQDWITLNSSSLGSGQHILSIETNYGTSTNVCSGVNSKIIDVVYQPNIHNTMPDSSFCNNTTLVYNAGSGTQYTWTIIPFGIIAGIGQTITINNSGIYKIEVNGGYLTRCLDIDTFETKIFTIPPIVDFGNDTTISSNQTLNLSLPSGYTDYSWNTGATTQSIIIDSTYNWVNNIIGTVTVNNQCFSTDDVFVYIGSVGLLENNDNTNIRIFPNPVNNEINIELDEDYGELTMKILNQNGQILKTDLFRGKTYNITDLERLSKGVYYLQLTNKQVNLVFKFIKK